jgi:signal transduction histidine kinase
MIVIPVLYFSIQSIVAEDVDESLIEQKDRLVRKLKLSDLTHLAYLQTLDPDITLTPAINANNKRDTFYTIITFDKIDSEETPYRILESNISVMEKLHTLQLKSSLLDSKDLIESIVKIVGAVLFLIVAGLILINRILSKRLWKPFYNTINKLLDFKIEKNELIHFEKTDITEFSTLNNSITKLTNRNQEIYQSQKEFTENASHEMQTPIAIFQGKLDLIMQTKPLTQEQYELISDLADVTQKMSRLNKSLLLLTKIENNQFFETENVSVKQILLKLTEQYRFQAEQRNITIHVHFTDDICITANRTLVEIMFGNFLSNSIKHNITNGSVVVNGSNTQVSFTNTGSSAALDADKLFQRFQKQTTDDNSIGLGLQISKKIADRYQYLITYTYQLHHHNFSVIVN